MPYDPRVKAAVWVPVAAVVAFLLSCAIGYAVVQNDILKESATFASALYLGLVATGLSWWGISQNAVQHELEVCTSLLRTWGETCEAEVCLLERELYSDPQTGDYWYYNVREAVRLAPGVTHQLTLGKFLAWRALQLVSMGGQPLSPDVHRAKQHLNRWAEDASFAYAKGKHKIPSEYQDLMEARARMYMRCAEPLNWAYHVSSLRHQSGQLRALLTAEKCEEDSRNPILWYASRRVAYMAKLSKVKDRWNGMDAWREPLDQFWTAYCGQQYLDNNRKVINGLDGEKQGVYATCSDFFSDANQGKDCKLLYQEMWNSLGTACSHLPLPL